MQSALQQAAPTATTTTTAYLPEGAAVTQSGYDIREELRAD